MLLSTSKPTQQAYSGSGIKLSESPNTRLPFVSILEILESCFYLNACIPILIVFVPCFLPIIIFILPCV